MERQGWGGVGRDSIEGRIQKAMVAASLFTTFPKWPVKPLTSAPNLDKLKTCLYGPTGAGEGLSEGWWEAAQNTHTIFVCLVFETSSHFVGQAGLEL